MSTQPPTRGRRARTLWLGAACVVLACSPEATTPATSADDETLPPQSDVDLEPPAEPYVWQLVDVGLQAGIQDRLGHQKGVGVADLDDNGHLDLFVTNPGEDPVLFLNLGDGTFRSQMDLPRTENDWGPVLFDYDVDGDIDVFVFCGGRYAPCADGAFRNDGVDPQTGDVVFTDVSEQTGIGGIERQAMGGVLADYDADGDLDIFVPVHFKLLGSAWDWDPNVSHADMLYRNNGDGTFTEVAEEAGVAGIGPSSASTWLDYDRDGYPDLYVPMLNAANILYHNEGDGTFTVATPTELETPWMGFGSIAHDFDNDGWVDLMVAEIYQTFISSFLTIPGTPGDRLFLNDAGQGWIDASVDSGLVWPEGESVAPRAGTMGYQAGDLDLDGYMEVFFGNGSPEANGGQTNRLISAQPAEGGGIAFVERSHEIDTEADDDGADPPYPSYPYRTHGSVFLDFDGDDDLDLFVGNGGHPPGQEEPNQLFRNDAADVHHWVRVKLAGKGQNPAGIGATIRVSDAAGDAATWTIYRLVSGTVGFHVTEATDPQVGVGKHAGPYVVSVRWSSGSQSVVEGVWPRSTVVVTEP